MKVLTGFLCAIVLAVIGMTTDAQAYTLTNNTTSATISGVYIEAICGPFGRVPFGPYALGPAPSSLEIILPPDCTVIGIIFRGVFYHAGVLNHIPPPNPPNFLSIGAGGATFW